MNCNCKGLTEGLCACQAAQGEGPPGPADPAKFSGKKSKAVAKQGAGNTQWAILKLSGIPEAEIPSFRCFSCEILSNIILPDVPTNDAVARQTCHAKRAGSCRHCLLLACTIQKGHDWGSPTEELVSPSRA